jgi:phage RecT family recombinase
MAYSPEIATCSPESVAYCVAMCALTELMPGGPLPTAYLIPRRAKGAMELQWQISWRGMTELARRAGWRIRAITVDKDDVFSVRRGLHEDLVHEPDPDRSPTYETLRGVYVVATHPTEPAAWEWVPKALIERRRQVSQSRSGPWTEWAVEMAQKTAIRYALGRGLVPLDDAGRFAVSRDSDEQATPLVAVSEETTQTPEAPQQAISAPTQIVEVAAGMDGLAQVLADESDKGVGD